ncbi:hypothetical protein AAIR29_04115 [Psychrobacter sp. FBL11]|uniref:Uncharacterized protein n=1 Tax=Psychrobacter saeujeotis TaxID=3143436 RepID=A0ABU9X8V5_9GAMM|nr:hypothetical protein [uncultured Psychrobacter sp.]
MIFKYGSSDFKILRDNLKKYFEEYIKGHDSYDREEKIIGVIMDILSDINIEKLTRLDEKELTFHGWDSVDKALSENFLSYDNKALWEVYNEETDGRPEETVLEAIYIALYADIYESSFIITDIELLKQLRFFIDRLNSKNDCLSRDFFQRITYLWFIVPKELFNKHLNKHLNTLQDLKNSQDFIKEKLVESDKLKTEIAIIQESLDEQKSEYNFVGLSKGFTNLKQQKARELETQNWAYYSLMVTIIIALTAKFFWSISYLRSDNFDNLAFIVTTVSTVLIILIILYFFRISLMNIKSIKSQILQIDLRLTLCQFIHSYDTGTESLRKEHMKGSLDKFESIIFAPIVATEENIPTTFDGLEQLTAMIGLFNRKSD